MLRPSLPSSTDFSEQQNHPVQLLLKTFHKRPVKIQSSCSEPQCPTGLHGPCLGLPLTSSPTTFRVACLEHPSCLRHAPFRSPQGSLPHLCSNQPPRPQLHSPYHLHCSLFFFTACLATGYTAYELYCLPQCSVSAEKARASLTVSPAFTTVARITKCSIALRGMHA